MAIGRTVALFRENSQLEVQVQSAQAAPENIARLSGELKAYDRTLSRFSGERENWEERLMQEVTRACQQYRAKLIQLPPATSERQNGYQVETRAVKLEGSYHALVQTLHALEVKAGIGRISAARFVTEEDRRSRSTSLFAYIYIQNIDKKHQIANE